jgi:hypothetical protein
MRHHPRPGEGPALRTAASLDRAVAYGRRALDLGHYPDVILVGWDLSRLFRPAAYDSKFNVGAPYTAADFALLRERTRPLILATILDPDLSEHERQSQRKRGRAGRHPSIDDALAKKIFTQHLSYFWWDRDSKGNDRRNWQTPLSKVAAMYAAYGVTRDSLRRASERPSPSGKTWEEEAYLRSQEMGLCYIDGNCVIPLSPLSDDKCMIPLSPLPEE